MQASRDTERAKHADDPLLDSGRCLIDDFLPDKLLEDIMLTVAAFMLGRDFYTLKEFDPRPLAGPLTMSQVCQRWRRVALDCARLWSNICVLDDVDLTTEVLRRSGGAALFIQLGGFRMGKKVSKINIEKVLEHSRRIRTLKLCPSAELDQILSQAPGGVYADLTMLEEIIMPFDHSVSRSSSPGVALVAKAPLPRLKSVQMSWCSGSLMKPFLKAGLRTLALTCVKTSDLPIVVQALLDMPLLEVFFLATSPLTNRRVSHLEDPTRDISLPHLRSLRLDDFHSCSILPRLLIPPTCSLRLGAYGMSDCLVDIAGLLPLLSHHVSRASSCRLNSPPIYEGYLSFDVWREPLSLDDLCAYIDTFLELDSCTELHAHAPSVAVHDIPKVKEGIPPLDTFLSSSISLSDVTSLYLCDTGFSSRMFQTFEHLQELALSNSPGMTQNLEIFDMLSQSDPPVVPHLRTLVLRGFNWCQHQYVPRPVSAALGKTVLSTVRARNDTGLALQKLTISYARNLKEEDFEALQQSQAVGRVLWEHTSVYETCSVCMTYREEEEMIQRRIDALSTFIMF